MHLIIYLQGANIHYIKRNDVLKIQFNFIIEHLIFVEAHVQTSNPPLIFTHLRCEILTTRLFSKRERNDSNNRIKRKECIYRGGVIKIL